MTSGILIAPLKPDPPFLQTSELSQKPSSWDPERVAEADGAVSAFWGDGTPGPPPPVPVDLVPSVRSWWLWYDFFWVVQMPELQVAGVP